MQSLGCELRNASTSEAPGTSLGDLRWYVQAGFSGPQWGPSLLLLHRLSVGSPRAAVCWRLPCVGVWVSLRTSLSKGDVSRSCPFCAPGQVPGGSSPCLCLHVFLPLCSEPRWKAQLPIFPLPARRPWRFISVVCTLRSPVSAFLLCPRVLALPGSLTIQEIWGEGLCFRLENHTRATPLPPTMRTSQESTKSQLL